MIARYKKFILILIFVFLPFMFLGSAFAQDSNEDKIKRLSEEIVKYENELDRLGKEANTLSNLINQYNTQIKLTQLKISQTEEKIVLLGGRIEQLKISLDTLNSAYEQRVNETYKISRFSEPHLLFLSMSNISDAINSFNYLKKLQASDISLLGRLEKAQNTYQNEKSDQEKLQKDLEVQNRSLSAQKIAKAQLLEQTKNNEKKYQDLISALKSELEAIQAIIAGKGDETLVGHVGEGQRIASIIQGSSCNSSGSHLHFIIAENRVVQNPFSYLRSGIDYENCSGSSCGSSDGDPFNPSGSWAWPISAKIKFTQGYGLTWAVRNTWVGRIYSTHNGIDVDSESSPEVKSVKEGTLYRGSYTGYNGCRLRYVRVDHDNAEIDTYYLHVNY